MRGWHETVKNGAAPVGMNEWRLVVTYLDLKEILWWSVDLLKGLLARLGDGLHGGVVGAGWVERGWRG